MRKEDAQSREQIDELGFVERVKEGTELLLGWWDFSAVASFLHLSLLHIFHFMLCLAFSVLSMCYIRDTPRRQVYSAYRLQPSNSDFGFQPLFSCHGLTRPGLRCRFGFDLFVLILISILIFFIFNIKQLNFYTFILLKKKKKIKNLIVP